MWVRCRNMKRILNTKKESKVTSNQAGIPFRLFHVALCRRPPCLTLPCLVLSCHVLLFAYLPSLAYRDVCTVSWRRKMDDGICSTAPLYIRTILLPLLGEHIPDLVSHALFPLHFLIFASPSLSRVRGGSLPEIRELSGACFLLFLFTARR